MTRPNYNSVWAAIGFRATLPWTLVTAAGVSVFALLGLWQLERSEEKRELLTQAEERLERPPLEALSASRELPPEWRFHPIELRGRYDSERQILLENMILDGQVGYQVLTPLRLVSGGTVLVNRGFVPADPRRDRLPAVAVPQDLRTVSGRLNTLPEPGLRLGESEPGQAGDPWPRVFLYPRPALLAEVLGESIPHYQIQLAPRQPDGFERRWETVNVRPARHLAYAVQWFAFALAAVVIYLVLGRRCYQRDLDTESK